MRFLRLKTQLRPCRRQKTEQGQALVLVSILLAAIGGMTALAVDLGSLTADRRDLQNAADAIALAASQELPNSSAAQAAAATWAVKNDVDPANMTVTITQQDGSNPNPKVRVEVDREHGFTFARLIGINSATVEAAAAAVKTSPGGFAHGGLVPWSITEAAKNSASPGTSLVLKYDSRNVTNGNFGAIRLDGNGANVYRDTIKYGSTSPLCAVGVADCNYPSTVTTQPGNVIGPSEAGTDYRLEGTDSACDTWDEVVISANGKQGLTAACNPFTAGGNPDSLRVIIVPIIQSLCNGACDVTTTEFALFFLEGYGSGGCSGNDCEIRGRFINSNTNLGATLGRYDSDASTAHFVRLVE